MEVASCWRPRLFKGQSCLLSAPLAARSQCTSNKANQCPCSSQGQRPVIRLDNKVQTGGGDSWGTCPQETELKSSQFRYLSRGCVAFAPRLPLCPIAFSPLYTCHGSRIQSSAASNLAAITSGALDRAIPASVDEIKLSTTYADVDTVFTPEASTSGRDESPGSDGTRWLQEHPELLQFAEESEKLRVAVLLSGGVDSSVALRLLKAAGHHCTAFYLKIWFQEDFRNFWAECPWEEDLGYAEAVCRQAGIELRVVHLTDEYWGRVVSHCVSEIQAGRTPNPDILCNSRVKFGAFYDRIDFAESDRVASGHYARLERGPEGTRLALCADEWKDQTYFLSHLSQQQLQRALFPLGKLPKAQVRQIAEQLELPNRARKDSQGICFLGKVKFSEFIAQHLGEQHGWLLEAETGAKLGTHRGFWFYTIGQRQGIHLSGGPWYVVSKDPATNVVFVSRRYYSDDKARRSFRAGDFSWVGGAPPPDLETRDLLCKVRHGPRFHRCTLQWEDRQEPGTSGRVSTTHEDTLERVFVTSERVSDIEGDDLPLSRQDGGLRKERVLIRLEEDDQGLAAGQYVALYLDGFCVGSGVIVEAMEEGGSDQVSPAARHAAATAGEVDLVAFAKYQAGAKGRKNKAKSKTSRSGGEDDSFVGIEQLRTTLDSDHVLLR